MMFGVWFSVFVACFVLFVVDGWCLLFVCCLLFLVEFVFVCWLMRADCWLVYGAWLAYACCLRFVVDCCLLLVWLLIVGC